ncbi:MAG TPA: IPT/TIG domain-containing protein [Vicinamibacteria bacterium]|nr:IPT/TIG domain-containing protein [Vicinamibacteria bacterium]
MSSDAAVPTLTVTGGPHDGQSLPVPVGAACIVGSGDGARLRLTPANVSAEHARVSHDAERGLVLADLGSVAGTYVNGEKVEGERPLREGDRICLGPPGAKASVKLLLVRAAPAAEEPAILLDAADEGVSLDASPGEPALILDDPGPATQAPPPAQPPAPPAPPPQPPPTAAAEPAPPAAKAAAEPAASKRAKPEYTEDVPSIVATMQRQPLPVPPAPPSVRPKPRRVGAPVAPRIAIAAGVALVVVVGSYLALRSFLKGPPVASTVLPPRVEGGQTVTLSGSGFGNDAKGVTVRVGDKPGKIVSASDTQVAVEVPDVDPEDGAAELKVVAETSGGASNPLVLTVTAPPRIAGLRPDVAMPGDEIVATGKHLKGKPLSVTVDGQSAEVLEATGDRLRFRVPELPVTPGRGAGIVVRRGREASKAVQLYLGRLPLLIEAAPARASAGDRVTLKGRGFAASAEANAVRFGSERALVLQAKEDELVVSTPAAGVITTQIEAPAFVETEKGRSNPVPFLIMRLSSGQFVPRYFAAPAPERPGAAFVAMELGPVLVLGGPGDAPRVVDRAVKIAAALNALVEEAQKRPVGLEARGDALAVVTGAVIASVTPDDVAVYEALSPPAKGRRVTAATVAALWAALVQDQLDLFVRRQRPARLVQVTPRGRAIMQLHSEALRRAGAGAGVPLSVVSPLNAALARDLREMALLVPVEGEVSAAAVMEGRWHGTMWEEGSGEKPIVVRLRAQGAKLTGSLTTTAGGISGDIPLHEASFERGMLRFAVTVHGARQQFEGRVEGDKVAGSITRTGVAGAVGRFTLTIAE